MSIEHLIAFNLVLVVTIASPGPAFLVSVQVALSAGRRAALFLGLGLAVMAIIWLALALLGIEILFSYVPWAYGLAKIIGALYLFYLAWKIWHGAREPLTKAPVLMRYAFLHGFLVNALNPKSALFATSVVLVIFPADMSFWECSIIVFNQFCIGIIFYSALAFAMGNIAMRRRYLGAKIYIDRTASLILGGLGLRLLVSSK